MWERSTTITASRAAKCSSSRSVKTSLLVEEFQKLGVQPRVAESVAAAVKLALAGAKPNDLICAAGSVFVIAEVMEEVGGLI